MLSVSYMKGQATMVIRDTEHQYVVWYVSPFKLKRLQYKPREVKTSKRQCIVLAAMSDNDNDTCGKVNKKDNTLARCRGAQLQPNP